jgi:hypothetical protein
MQTNNRVKTPEQVSDPQVKPKPSSNLPQLTHVIPLNQLRAVYRLALLDLVPRLVADGREGSIRRQGPALAVVVCPKSAIKETPNKTNLAQESTYRYPLIVNAPQTSKSPCTSIVPLILSFPKILTLSLQSPSVSFNKPLKKQMKKKKDQTKN